MRAINADDLRSRMYHEAFEKDTDMQKWDSGCWIRYKLFENVLDEQPTIEIDCDEKEIGYAECANAMLKMWIDNVVTDGEYNRIMDRLNVYWEGR